MNVARVVKVAHAQHAETIQVWVPGFAGLEFLGNWRVMAHTLKGVDGEFATLKRRMDKRGVYLWDSPVFKVKRTRSKWLAVNTPTAGPHPYAVTGRSNVTPAGIRPIPTR